MMTELTTDLIRQENEWILKLNGAIDSNSLYLMWFMDSSASLLKEMKQNGANKLLIDLTNVETIDSQGLRMLLSAQKEFSREDVSIRLKNPNSHLKRLFRIMQFDRVFDVIHSNG
jgi:anti-anti-sigma factor